MGGQRGDGDREVDEDDWVALGEHGHALADVISQQERYAHEAVQEAESPEPPPDPPRRRQPSPALQAGLKPSSVASPPGTPIEERLFHVARTSSVIHISPYCRGIRGYRSADVEPETFEVTLGDPFCRTRRPCRICIKDNALRDAIEVAILQFHT